jgi:galactokinase
LTLLRERLETIGLSATEAVRKEALFERATAALREQGHGGEPVIRLWVPGRIEVLGKHTDYAGGRSLLCAIERGFCVVAVPRADHRVRVRDARAGEVVEGTLDARTSGIAGHWGNYPLTVVRRVGANFVPPLAGMDMAFASDLPIAAGISSSSALVVATFLALSETNRLEMRAEYTRAIDGSDSLAEYLGAVENGLDYRTLKGERGVGTFGGSEDHTAILSARPNALVQYSFCPVRHEQTVDLPPEHVFVIATSGVVAEKTGAALESYNRLATLARSATERWRAASGRSDATLGDALRSAAGDVEPILDSIRSASEGDDAALVERVRQFAIESESTIPAAVEALASGRLAELGALVDRSMLNAERMLHNQISETIFLARRARELGAIAASAFGAGFGGSVWALASHAHAESLAARLAADYRERFPQHADLAEAFVTQAGPPAATI